MPEEKDKFIKWVEKRVNEELEKSQVLFRRAQKKIPKEYHDFLVSLRQISKIASKKLVEVPTNLKFKGVFTTDGGTFVPVHMPYFNAEGRLSIARDEHIKNGKTLYIKTAVNASDKPEKINLGYEVLIPPFCAVAVVESELKGVTFGTAGMTQEKGWQKQGSDSSEIKQWDVEKAETSAIARALLFMGYGILGTAFIEEEETEKKEKEEKKKEEEYKQKVTEFKALQTKKKISDGDLKKMAKEIGISKIATVEDLEALIKLMGKLPDPKKPKEKEEEPEELI